MTPSSDPAAARLAVRKRELRDRMRAQWRSIPAEERAAASAKLCDQVRQAAEWRNARQVFLFAPRRDEADIWPLVEEALREGRRVALPRFRAEENAFEPVEIRDPVGDIAKGAFGIREPVEHLHPMDGKCLDLTLVPGLAFARDGGRLGRGKGYYDRLLPALGGGFYGVAMDWQVLPSIPVGPLDESLNGLVTPTRWLTARPAR